MATRSEKMSVLQDAIVVRFLHYFDGMACDLETLIGINDLLTSTISEIAVCDRCSKQLDISDYNSHNSEVLCNECYATMAGRWMCVWGNGYQTVAGQAKMTEADSSYFTTDNGYNRDDYQIILQLQLGEAYACNESGKHVIVRIK